MTAQTHARVEKLIINLDTALPNVCSWHDCERPSRTPYQIISHEHPRRYTYDGAVYTGRRLCGLVDAAGGAVGRHYHYAFCSDGCRDLFANCTGTNALDSIARTGRAHGNHSPGMRRPR